MVDAEPCRDRPCIRLATSKHELSQAFSLVYQRYREAGLVEPNRVRLRIIRQHLLPTTEVVVLSNNDEVFGTASLVGDSIDGLPLESAYEAEVDNRRSQRIRLAEISCLADRREGIPPRLLIALMAFTVQCARHRGVDQILIAVHPRHVGFYTRCLGFDVFAGLRSYERVGGNPAIGLCLDMNDLAVRAPAAHRRLFGASFSSYEMDYRPLSQEARQYVRSSLQVIESSNSYHQTAMAC